jgi:hypothetical protein
MGLWPLEEGLAGRKTSLLHGVADLGAEKEGVIGIATGVEAALARQCICCGNHFYKRDSRYPSYLRR